MAHCLVAKYFYLSIASQSTQGALAFVSALYTRTVNPDMETLPPTIAHEHKPNDAAVEPVRKEMETIGILLNGLLNFTSVSEKL